MASVKNGNYYMLFLVVFNLLVQISLVFFVPASVIMAFAVTPYFYIATQAVLYGLPFLIYLLLTRNKLANVLPLRWPGFANVGLILAMCICMSPLMMLVSGFTSMFYDNAAMQVFDDLSQAPLAVTIFSICVMPAVFEEINFRGVILTNYRKMDIKKAAVVNGLFFGLIHFNLQQFLYAFLLGVVFALFVYYTKSILSSVIAHFFINASQLLSSVIFPAEVAEISTEAVTWNDLLYISVIAAIAVPFFIMLYVIFVRRNKELADL